MDRPNILLLSGDQHNAEILGCMGNPVVRTPHLDALAASGVTFTQAFTPFPVCTPARTSVFTGLRAGRHGVAHNVNMNFQPGKPGLAPDKVAFPQLLAAAGYQTALIGKLHTRHEGGMNFGLQTMTLAEGKCHFVSSPEAEDDYRRYLRERGYPPDVWRVWENDPSYAENGFVTSPLPDEDYIDTWIANRAIDYIHQARQPFFLWVSFCTPHNPWDPPRPYDSMYSPADIPMPHRRLGELEKKPRQWVDKVAQTIHSLPSTSIDPSLPGGVKNAYKRFPEEKTRRMLAAYYGQISHLDAQVGRVVSALQQAGAWDDTLAFYLADHGDYCGNNWAFYKYAGLYESLIRVPLLMRLPGNAGAGQSIDRLGSLCDIMPTVLRAAGIEIPEGLDGRPLQELIDDGECAWRQKVVVEGGSSTALVTPEWKFCRWRDGTEELYDRRRDPHDLDNLAVMEESRGVRVRLHQELASALKTGA